MSTESLSSKQQDPNFDLDAFLSGIFAAEEVQIPHVEQKNPYREGTDEFDFHDRSNLATILNIADRMNTYAHVEELRVTIIRSLMNTVEEKRLMASRVFKDYGLLQDLKRKSLILEAKEAEERRLAKERKDEERAEEWARKNMGQLLAAQKKAAERQARDAEAKRQQALLENDKVNEDKKSAMPGIFRTLKFQNVLVDLYFGHSKKRSDVIRVNYLSSPLNGLTENSTYKVDLSNAPQVLKAIISENNLDISALMQEAAQKRNALAEAARKAKEPTVSTSPASNEPPAVVSTDAVNPEANAAE